MTSRGSQRIPTVGRRSDSPGGREGDEGATRGVSHLRFVVTWQKLHEPRLPLSDLVNRGTSASSRP
jgi:hypothetical protein